MHSFASAPFRRNALLALLLPLLSTFGCDCVGQRLVIVDPEAGRVLTAADDANATLGGLQFEVVVDATGFDAGDEVRLHVGLDPDTLLSSTTVFRDIVQPDGRVRIDSTLPNGVVHMVACFGADDGCKVRSPRRTVTVTGSAVGGDCVHAMFLEPARSGSGTLVLGGSDDVATADGACGAAFAIPVSASVDSSEGATATLFVDGIPTANATVTNGEVRFAAVQLGVRGADETSTLSLVVGDSLSCATTFPQLISVDCGGPSCKLERPIEGIYLNNTLDVDPATPALELNLSANSKLDTASNEFTLVDAAASTTLATATSVVDGSQATATFLGVAFVDGPARFFAECTDGEVSTRSAIASYLVDSTACTVAFDAPMDRATLTSVDDVDSAAPGLQIKAELSVSGEECTHFRVSTCTSLTTSTFIALEGTSATKNIDLATASTQALCAEVRDARGNIGASRIEVSVEANGEPRVAIVSPTPTTKVNRDGGLGYTIDLTTNTTSCELAAMVDCSVLGAPVDLFLDGATTALASASCLANPASLLGGRASFGSVSIPTSLSSAHSFVARQTSGALTGVSQGVSFGADCEPPVLALIAPSSCPVNLSSADDVSPSIPGMQIAATVSSPNTPQLDVVATVSEQGGASTTTTSLASNLPPGATNHGFAALDLGGAGTKSLTMSAVDSFANQAATTPCALEVSNLPAIALTPLATTSFTAANAGDYDCNTGSQALDLLVSGTTNASEGSSVVLQIGGAPALTVSVMGGMFSGCVIAPDGASNITAMVNDTVTSDGISGMASALPIAITVSITPLSGTIDPVTVSTLDRRAGVLRFAFTAIGDEAGMPLASYGVRCANAPITTEGLWTAAAVHPVDAQTPSNPGVAEALTVRGFRTGTSQYCVVRGFDGAGNPSLLPNPTRQPIAKADFLVATYDAAVASTSMGIMGAWPAGDVNGDDVSDFIVTGSGAAFLFLGRPGGATPILATTFAKDTFSWGFGVVARGIGDFNQDGLDDLVIADSSGSDDQYRGEVFVFYGRSSWPASFTLSESSCDASFCVRAPNTPFYGFGTDVAALGDFDGRPGPDFAVGAGWSNMVFVLSGSTGISAGTNYVIDTNDPTGFRVVGPTVGSYFGWTLGAPGNISGSSHTELLVGEFATPSRLYRLDGRAYSGSGLVMIPAAELASIAGGITLSDNFGTQDSLGITTGDFDGDSFWDLFVYTSDAADVDVGVYVLYGDSSASFPMSNSARLLTAVSPLAASDFGKPRAISSHPVFGRLGDLDRDNSDELLVGGLSVSSATNFSAGLLYGRPRLTAPLRVEDEPQRLAVLEPVIEAYAPAGDYIWTVGFPGDVVNDTSTPYADLIVCDPGSSIPGVPGVGARCFVLY